jgi:membrane protein
MSLIDWKMHEHLKKQFRKLSLSIQLAIRMAKRISFIGFQRAPVFDVFRFFFKGIIKGRITTRASAVAFDFFVAIFPTIIFIFTLIPYILVDNFQQELLDLIKGIIPSIAFELIESTLVEVVTQKSWGLLSFGFIAAVFFSHNGISALIDSFNATYHTIETRSFINQHLIAFLLTFLLPTLVALAVVLVIFGEMGLTYLVDKSILALNFTYFLIVIMKWVIVVGLFFFSISFLYYLAPAKRTKYRFFSAGSIMATLMILVTSLVFSFYVNRFGQYNALYGSIGSLLALMFWIYFNAIGLIVGFELNVSISSASSQYFLDIKNHEDEKTKHIGHSEGVQPKTFG